MQHLSEFDYDNDVPSFVPLPSYHAKKTHVNADIAGRKTEPCTPDPVQITQQTFHEEERDLR